MEYELSEFLVGQYFIVTLPDPNKGQAGPQAPHWFSYVGRITGHSADCVHFYADLLSLRLFQGQEPTVIGQRLLDLRTLQTATFYRDVADLRAGAASDFRTIEIVNLSQA
jgi:hypothetical protein